MIKLIGAILILGALLLAAYSNTEIQEVIRWKTATNSQKLAILVETDIASLEAAQQLPKEWAQISHVTYSINSDIAKKLLQDVKPQLEKVKKSDISLEVEIFDIPDDKKPGIILQMSLQKGPNKIYEIGRNIYLDELNKD